MRTANYFAWTANLGVVPLLRSAAFLFAPDLRAFAFLRFSVTAVLDAMVDSSIYFKISLIVLAFDLFYVKEIMAAPSESEDLILAKGEQKEVSIPGLKNLSIGNKGVISYKVLSKSQTLLIKGSKVGFTDLVIWGPSSKKTFKIYVLSKTKFLQTTQLSEALKDLNLTLNLKGPVVTVTGEIHKFEDYLYLHQLKTQFKTQIFFDVRLDLVLERWMAAHIYRQLFKHGFNGVACEAQGLEMICHWEGAEAKSPETLKDLTERWFIHFVRRESRFKGNNFKIRLKLIQVERADGREINFGLSKLQASPLDLFNYGLQKLIEQNIFLLSESHLQLSTLAEPETILQTGKDLLIEVGAQIPYQNISTQGSTVIAPIDWKFAGLKIKAQLRENFGKLYMDYQTEFSRPMGLNISGSKEESSLMILPGKAYKIFQIGYQTQGNLHEHLPGLKDIPLLRNLFGSTSDQSTYKRIEGYLFIEEHEKE